MVVTVPGRELLNVFKDFVGKNKVLINFKIIQNRVAVQILDTYTACTDISCLVLDSSGENEASFWATNSLLIFTRDEEVKLTITDAAISIDQGLTSCYLTREYEERRTFPDTSEFQLQEAYANRLKYFAHIVTSGFSMSKELSIPEPDPVFTGGKFYADYRQAFIVDEIKYPEFCISMNTLKSFAYKLDEKSKFTYLHDKSMLYFKSSQYEFWIPTLIYNINAGTVNAVEKQIQNLLPVGKISIKSFKERLGIIVSAFPKHKLAFSINETQFSIGVSTNNSHILVGNLASQPSVIINITTGQLNTIVKLFGDDEEPIEVLRGGRVVCLRKKTLNLLIAGVTY